MDNVKLALSGVIAYFLVATYTFGFAYNNYEATWTQDGGDTVAQALCAFFAGVFWPGYWTTWIA